MTEARLIHWGASNAYYVPMSDQDGPVQKILHAQVEIRAVRVALHAARPPFMARARGSASLHFLGFAKLYLCIAAGTSRRMRSPCV